MKRLATLAVTLAAVSQAPMPTAVAATSTCGSAVDLTLGSAHCYASADQAFDFVAKSAAHVIRVDLACSTDNATCLKDVPTCQSVGLTGDIYDVREDGLLLPWQACLTPDQAAALTGLTPGVVERAYKRLTWPASNLVIQPPGGKTLVNFATNFYTTNTHPTTQTVTLLGQHITIEATPTQYTWHFDDPASTQPTLTTTDPGAPYPNLHITHRYTQADTAHPSLETTYTGRYRVNQGPWHTIPTTLTVPGTPLTLQILTATPHLVG